MKTVVHNEITHQRAGSSRAIRVSTTSAGSGVALNLILVGSWRDP